MWKKITTEDDTPVLKVHVPNPEDEWKADHEQMDKEAMSAGDHFRTVLEQAAKLYGISSEHRREIFDAHLDSRGKYAKWTAHFYQR